MKQEADLYSWEIYINAYSQRCVRGIIANDSTKRWPDGRRVFTSPIVSRSSDRITTHNTIYNLKDKWEGGWSLRDLDGNIIEQTGPVHFDNVRTGRKVGA